MINKPKWKSKIVLRILLVLILVLPCIAILPLPDLFYHHMLRMLYANTVDRISADELHTILETEPLVLLDTREQPEFEVSHLPGAIHFAPSGIDSARLKGVRKSAKVVVYCTAGIRSEQVGEQLIEKGYTNVLNLDGGVISWKNADYQLVGLDALETDSVHVYNNFWGFWLVNGVKVHD